MLIRVPALLFAVVSTVYWLTLRDLDTLFVTAGRPLPYWHFWVIHGLPPLLYACICVGFAHWIARRVRNAGRGVEN